MLLLADFLFVCVPVGGFHVGRQRERHLRQHKTAKQEKLEQLVTRAVLAGSVLGNLQIRDSCQK